MMTKYENRTIDYYDLNAEAFVSGTRAVDFLSTQKRFTKKLPAHAVILDFGCGSGRDTKYFLSQGYQVEATDGSVKLCRLASEYTGIKVKHLLFQELAEVERYDGIWACASVLHLSPGELTAVMKKMVLALKEQGILYLSFKYGSFVGERRGRYFTDMTEETFMEFLKQITEVEIEEQWITDDVRPERGEEKWFNVILRKKKVI